MKRLDLPETSIELLKTAILKDNAYQSALARNYAVVACLAFSDRLLEICQTEPQPKRDQLLLEIVKIDALPANFLILTATCLRRIHDRINELIRKQNNTTIPVVTDFDGYAIRALGLTFSDIMWPDKPGNDFTGPPVAECIGNFGKSNREFIWMKFTQHYIGNILQHYFEKSGVRRDTELRDLIPKDEEERIREADAYQIADFCSGQFKSKKLLHPTPFDYMDTLSDALQIVIKQENHEQI